MRRTGIFIALSGVDCSGKSTQRDLLVDELRARGLVTVNIYSRPGYSPGLRFFRRLLRALGHRRSVRTGVSPKPGLYPRRAASLDHPLRRRLWLALGLLDLLWVYVFWIRWLQARGRAVVCNRYLLDALVDLRVNFPDDAVERGWLWRSLRRFGARPAAAFCLFVPVEHTIERARRKARFHWETPAVLAARYSAYESLCPEFGVQALDGLRPSAALAEAIQGSLEPLLAERGHTGRPARAAVAPVRVRSRAPGSTPDSRNAGEAPTRR